MKILRFLILGLLTLVLFTSCEKQAPIKPMKTDNAAKVVRVPLQEMADWPEDDACDMHTFDLIAGQYMYAGSVHAAVEIVDGVPTLFVKYEAFGDCEITEAHLFVGNSASVIPANKPGNPKIGHFPYFWDEMGPETEVVFSIPVEDLDLLEDGCFKIAAHAVVICDGVEETAWARGSDLVFALKTYVDDGQKFITGQEVPDAERWEERIIYYSLLFLIT